MNFRPVLALAVMDGRKTVTRRGVSENPRSPWWTKQCALRMGRTYAICPGRGRNAVGRVEVVSVRKDPLHFVIRPGEAEAEGFPDFYAFREAWASINGAYRPMDRVWRVQFRVVETAECICWGHDQEDTNPACVWHGDYGLRVVTARMVDGRAQFAAGGALAQTGGGAA